MLLRDDPLVEARWPADTEFFDYLLTDEELRGGVSSWRNFPKPSHAGSYRM